MARKKQSARLAEAQQERAAAEEKRKRKHEAAAKEVRKDSKVFDPPPAPLMEPSGSKGPFEQLTREDLDTVSAWSSDLCASLVQHAAARENCDDEEARFSSLTIRLIAEVCARPARKLVDDLRKKKWDGKTDDLASHVQDLLGTSVTSEWVLEFVRDAAAKGATPWLLSEFDSLKRGRQDPDRSRDRFDSTLENIVRDDNLAESIMLNGLNRTGCEEPVLSAAIGMWFGILNNVISVAFQSERYSGADDLRGLIWGKYENKYEADGGSIDEADRNLTEDSEEIDYTVTAAAVLGALLTGNSDSRSYFMITGMDRYETEGATKAQVEKLPLMATLRRAEDAKEVSLRRMAQWRHLEGLTAEEVEQSEHTDEIRHFLPTLLTSGALKEAPGKIGDHVRHFLVCTKAMDMTEAEEEEQSSKRQKTVTEPVSIMGKTISFAGHGNHFQLFRSLTKEAAKAAAEKAGAQFIPWTRVRYAYRNGGKYWDFIGYRDDDDQVGHTLGTLDILVVPRDAHAPVPAPVPGDGQSGQVTEMWTEEQFRAAVKAGEAKKEKDDGGGGGGGGGDDDDDDY